MVQGKGAQSGIGLGSSGQLKNGLGSEWLVRHGREFYFLGFHGFGILLMAIEVGIEAVFGGKTVGYCGDVGYSWVAIDDIF